MAYMDTEKMTELWQHIAETFARRVKSIGSIVFSGTSLAWSNVDGTQLGSVDLGDTFATDAEAAHSLSASGFKLTLSSVTGAALTSALDLTAQAKTALNGYFARGLTWSSSTNKLTLDAGDGTDLDSVTIPIPDLTDYATKTYVGTHAITQVVYEGRTSNTITLGFYNDYGTQLDTVSFYVGDI